MIWRFVEKVPPSVIVAIWRRLPKSAVLRRFLRRMADRRFSVGVSGLIYAQNGDLLIVKHTYGADPWGLPGGALKREQPFDGLVREVDEETGFSVEPLEILDVIMHKDGHVQVIIKAKLIGGLFTPSPEVSEYGFIRPPKGLDKLSGCQQRLVKKYSEKSIRSDEHAKRKC